MEDSVDDTLGRSLQLRIHVTRSLENRIAIATPHTFCSAGEATSATVHVTIKADRVNCGQSNRKGRP
jgi:hypothetical protein